MSIAAWHGCVDHDRNHCPECRTCGHYDTENEED